MSKKYLLVAGIGVLVIGAGDFFSGMKYQENKRPNLARQFSNGQARGSNNRGGFRPVNGEILSSSDKSITVKLQDGSSKIVLLSDKTEINKASTVTREELKVSEKVAVFGTENPDGSVTAQNIQLNPQFRGLPRDPSASASTGPKAKSEN